MENKQIIIFDGVCNFCNSAVNFILKMDKAELFQFTPMQSNFAKTLVMEYEIPSKDFDTILLIKDNIIFAGSEAALEITKGLSGYWFLFVVFRILPIKFRDYFYKLFAKNRYRLFGKRDVCMVPPVNQKSRFIQ